MLRDSPLLLESLRPLRRREYNCLVELGVFDEERVELLDGVLVSMNPQGAEHAEVTAFLAERLTVSLSGRARVRAHSPLSLSDESEPEPDIAVVPAGDYARAHPTRALHLIEVADSSLRRDRELKAVLYAATVRARVLARGPRRPRGTRPPDAAALGLGSSLCAGDAALGRGDALAVGVPGCDGRRGERLLRAR